MQARTSTTVDLDRRRGWFAAVVACLAGTLVFGLSCAGLVLSGFVAVARFWSFWGAATPRDRGAVRARDRAPLGRRCVHLPAALA